MQGYSANRFQTPGQHRGVGEGRAKVEYWPKAACRDGGGRRRGVGRSVAAEGDDAACKSKGDWQHFERRCEFQGRGNPFKLRDVSSDST